MADVSIINNPWFAIGTSLVSGFIAVIVSIWHYKLSEIRKLKLDCFRKLLGSRYVLIPGEHSSSSKEILFQALNEVVIVFSDSNKVIQALKVLHENLMGSRPELFEDNITSLFKAMTDDLKLDRTTLNDSFFLKPFHFK
jgi:hypothetical protein